MSSSWWKMSPDALDADVEALERRRIDYYNCFYGTPEGRRILFDLTNMCFSADGSDAEIVARIRLLGQIKQKCGFTADYQMAAIEAEASTGQGE